MENWEFYGIHQPRLMESKGIQWYNQQTSTQEINDGIPQEISIPPVSRSGHQVCFRKLHT